jgi:hypothetical protein
MYLEHGSEPVFLDFGEIVKQNGNPKKQPKKQTKKQMKENKKLEQAARAEEWVAKIKTKHDIDIAEPTEYTFTALKKIHRTGEMQEKRKKRTTTPFMRFLAKERIENRTVANPIPSKEITKLAGQKWRLMSDEQKAAWKVAEIQKPEEDTVEPVVEIQTEEDTVEPVAEIQTEEDTVEPVVEIQTEEDTVELVAELVAEIQKAPKKAKKAPKMKKPELVVHLTETHGWGAKLLSKFIVSELHQAMETGELPTEAMEKRKCKSKKKKKTEKKTKDTVSEEKVAVVSTAEQEQEAEPETSGMFEMSDSDSDSEGEDEDE